MNYIEIPPEQSFYFHHDIWTQNTGEEIVEKHYHNHFEIYFIETVRAVILSITKHISWNPAILFLCQRG